MGSFFMRNLTLKLADYSVQRFVTMLRNITSKEALSVLLAEGGTHFSMNIGSLASRNLILHRDKIRQKCCIKIIQKTDIYVVNKSLHFRVRHSKIKIPI